jgi:hypothetical protein
MRYRFIIFIIPIIIYFCGRSSLVYHSNIIIKSCKKIRIFKDCEKENFTSSMSIGYCFLFWWLFVNESPLNAKFVLGCSPLQLHHKSWLKKTQQEIEGNYGIKVSNKIKVADGTFQGPKDVSYVFETHIMYLDVWFFSLTYGIIWKSHTVETHIRNPRPQGHMVFQDVIHLVPVAISLEGFKSTNKNKKQDWPNVTTTKENWTSLVGSRSKKLY